MPDTAAPPPSPPSPPLPSSGRARVRAGRVVGLLGGLLAVGLMAWAAQQWSLQRGRLALQEAARPALDLAATQLDAELQRLDHLPSLLSTSADVMGLLARNPGGVEADAVSRRLAALNRMAGSDNLYLLDAQGRVQAAADHDRPGTPMGQDLSYRPYWREAMAQGRGRFYGVGVTSGRAGYYLAYALPADGPPAALGGRPLGVATVKVNLSQLERTWQGQGHAVLVVDEHEVVILATEDAWHYRPRQPLSEATRRETLASRRYGSAPLLPLDWRPQAATEGLQRVRLDGQDHLLQERAVNDGRWRLVLLSSEQPVRAAARNAALSAGLFGVVMLLLLALALQRRHARRQRAAAQAALQMALQAAHDSLERKVRERSEALQQAQHQLLHASKLAALGQLSAAMVHEFNQPLAAMRTLSDNAVMLMARGRLPEAQANLARIGRVVGRLGRLTNQLKAFAHKSEAPVSAVPIAGVVDEALALVADRIEALAVQLQVHIQPPELCAAAPAMELEQVLGNLLQNALDALQTAPERRLVLSASAQGSRCHIELRNSGPPIDPSVMASLFEPFVTTKPAGQGLGLGLMISQHLIQQAGGELRARNLPEGGVAFSVDLPGAAGPAPTPNAAPLATETPR